MPSETLHDFKSKTPGFVSEWTETTGPTAGSPLSVTKAASANNSHFITGIIVTSFVADGGAQDDLVIELKDGTTVLLKFNMLSLVQGAGEDDTGAAVNLNFPSPIQITEGAAASVVMTGQTGYASGCINIIGFTSSVRVS